MTFDYDNDGDLDVFIANNGEHPVLYRNDSTGLGNWIKINTEGTESNRDGICAFITIIPDSNQPSVFCCREVDGGSNFIGQNEKTVHFGVGMATQLDEVRIEWPSGIVQTYVNVNTNQTLSIIEALLGDANQDGVINLLDVAPFVDTLLADEFTAEADVNGDGVVNLLDVNRFVQILLEN